jgi:hypothetical protein
MESALRERLAPAELHHQWGHDRTFLFDFTESPIAPMVTVPGFRHPPTPPYSIPTATAKEGERVQIHAVLRAQIMNAHQACLATSEHVVKNRSAMMGFPVTASNTLIGLTFNDASQNYHDDTENMHALSRNVLNNKFNISERRPFSRRLVEIEIVEHSLNLLDNIICSGGEKLIQLVETTYISACRYSEHRYGEAVILAWGVCEQLISSAWDKLIRDTQGSGIDKSRIPKARREKLTGRDYSASVMVEVLEIAGRIDTDLYRMLEIARKARNNWAHRMKSPKGSEVYTCIRAVETLLERICGANISFQFAGRSSSTPWPYWFWERMSGSRAP